MESRIQSYLRIAASQQRDTEQIGSFLATFSRSNDNPFLNHAIPDDNATPSPADVAALIVAYEKRSRKPRLEYVAQLAPAVEGVLIDVGFRVEGYLPLMTCTHGDCRYRGTCCLPSFGCGRSAHHSIGTRSFCCRCYCPFSDGCT